MELSAEELERANHDCRDHWEVQDDSFNHEYGTQTVVYKLCPVCGLTVDYDHYDDDDYF